MRTNTAAVTAGGYNYVGEPGAAGQENAVRLYRRRRQLLGSTARRIRSGSVANAIGNLPEQRLWRRSRPSTTARQPDVTVTVQWADAYTVADGNEIVTFTTELLQ